jgi:hypothetical protein
MVNPAQGPSAVPLVLAIAALVAASASIAFYAGERGGPTERITTSASVRTPVKTESGSVAAGYVRVEGAVTTLAPAGDPSGNDVGSSRALCPSGTRVVSGGYQTVTGGGETFYSDALTGGRAGWAVGAANRLGTSGTVQAFAYCVRSGKARRGDRRTLARQRAAVRRQMKALGNRYRALRASQL